MNLSRLAISIRYPSVPHMDRPRWQLIHLSRAQQKHRLGSLELLVHQQVDPGGPIFVWWMVPLCCLDNWCWLSTRFCWKKKIIEQMPPFKVRKKKKKRCHRKTRNCFFCGSKAWNLKLFFYGRRRAAEGWWNPRGTWPIYCVFSETLGVNLDNVCFNDVKIYVSRGCMHFVKFPAKWHYKYVEKATVLVVLLQGATTYYAIYMKAPCLKAHVEE